MHLKLQGSPLKRWMEKDLNGTAKQPRIHGLQLIGNFQYVLSSMFEADLRTLNQSATHNLLGT